MLEDKLIEYKNNDIYPFHMPGHKRVDIGGGNPYSIDLTEVEGSDNLHDAAGIIAQAQEEAGRMYGAQHCHFLVNGSTCGLLASISAACEKGQKVLVARNCHKAVYNAIYLRELTPIYIYPKLTEAQIAGSISPSEVEAALEADDIKAIIITSPTYDGVLSDISAIARIAHSRGIPLIVDAAHGAHHGLGGGFPENPISLGADAVILSVHKTLPCFTQSALLLTGGSLINDERVRFFLSIYESSSPSYLLMAGIDRGLAYTRENVHLLAKLQDNITNLHSKCEGLSSLRVIKRDDLGEAAFDFDPSKIIIKDSSKRLSGQDIYDLLLKDYKLMLEMAAGDYALALATMMDSEEGFGRLAEAIIDIDRRLEAGSIGAKCEIPTVDASIYKGREAVVSISQALEMETKEIAIDAAIGQVSATYINLYPPGIPLIVPGERIDESLVAEIGRIRELGMGLSGLTEDGMTIILKCDYLRD